MPPRLLKLSLCPACADALRAILLAQGHEAMGRAVADVLCSKCWPPDLPHDVVTRFKGPAN